MPARYLLFYFALIDELALGDLLAVPLERRVGERPAYLTREEARWLAELERQGGFPTMGPARELVATPDAAPDAGAEYSEP